MDNKSSFDYIRGISGWNSSLSEKHSWQMNDREIYGGFRSLTVLPPGEKTVPTSKPFLTIHAADTGLDGVKFLDLPWLDFHYLFFGSLQNV